MERENGRFASIKRDFIQQNQACQDHEYLKCQSSVQLNDSIEERNRID